MTEHRAGGGQDVLNQRGGRQVLREKRGFGVMGGELQRYRNRGETNTKENI